MKTFRNADFVIAGSKNTDGVNSGSKNRPVFAVFPRILVFALLLIGSALVYTENFRITVLIGIRVSLP